ncbi:MAG: prepilin peptidase [Candidatus Pacearchaeota archaeon]
MEAEIFFFILVLLFIASLQDFKRREIDVWLNLFIFFCGLSFVIFKSFFYNEVAYLVNFSFLLVFVFILAHLIYFGKVFAGGDCSLLFCLSPFFVSIDFFSSFKNFLFFFVVLFALGSFYGFFWSFSLFVKNFAFVRKKLFSGRVLISSAFIFLFLFLSFFFKEFIFIFFIGFFLFFSYLFLKLEKELFIKEVLTKDLREGDWLEKDLRVNGKIIKSTFDGLSKKDIYFLRNNLRKVKIKDGIPYGFAFFLAWIAYYFLDFIMEFLVSKLVI